MNNRGAYVLAAAGLACFILMGCVGAGSRYISNQDGEVERGKLVLDSIPMRPDSAEYVIGHGDAIDIIFLYNTELNQIELKIRPDGKISLPYVGDVVAAGRPVSALDSLITARYSEIILDPDITIVMRKFRPEVVYTIGEIRNPGGYDFNSGMTLLNALTLCGGPDKSAKRSEVLVIRRIAPDHIIGIQVNLDDLLSRKHFELDVPLQPYDIVYVPKSSIARGQDFMNALKDLLMNPADLYLKGWQVANVEILYDYYRRGGGVY
jgi:polysaccharide export outer membrane protein